jgi:hypothetical protein
MRATIRPLIFALPALALASCYSAPPRTVTVQAPPPPVIVAAPPVYSGSSVAPAISGVPVRLTATAAQQLLADNTAVGLTDDGTPFDVYFGGDGTARFRMRAVADGGTWRILPDGTLCSPLSRVAQGGADSCYTLSQDGDVILYHRPDGVALGSIRVVTGNPRNL